ncbi:hypothetical protein NPIL_92451 [Nephila pilipes]|uniref:Uncharacterized protein n=1 Tax=Nephila pilipes TaxID=299642 RepID=A0A8X6PBQ8_NEPPI|nr:hypothetical protein NPIL_92451 [Nephila pilipes]
MEETITNVLVTLDEYRHQNVTPLEKTILERRDASVATEEIIENPWAIRVYKTVAIQTILNEETIIPKTNSCDVGTECVNMEVDILSQESVMDISSQESLSKFDSLNPEAFVSKNQSCENGFSCDQEAVAYKDDSVSRHTVDTSLYQSVLADREKDIQARETAMTCRERAIEEREAVLADRERVVEEREAALVRRENAIEERESALADRERVVKEREDALVRRENAIEKRESALADRERIVKKREVVVSKEKADKAWETALVGRERAVEERESICDGRCTANQLSDEINYPETKRLKLQ